MSEHDTDPSELSPRSSIPDIEPIPGAPPWTCEMFRRFDSMQKASEDRMRTHVNRVFDRAYADHSERIVTLEKGHKRTIRRIGALEYSRVIAPMLPGLIALVLSTIALVR
jgi:hypothetical protein